MTDDAYKKSGHTLNILHKHASIVDLLPKIENSKIPYDQTAIVLDYDQTLTMKCPDGEGGFRQLAIRGGKGTCDTLLQLKKKKLNVQS